MPVLSDRDPTTSLRAREIRDHTSELPHHPRDPVFAVSIELVPFGDTCRSDQGEEEAVWGGESGCGAEKHDREDRGCGSQLVRHVLHS